LPHCAACRGWQCVHSLEKPFAHINYKDNVARRPPAGCGMKK